MIQLPLYLHLLPYLGPRISWGLATDTVTKLSSPGPGQFIQLKLTLGQGTDSSGTPSHPGFTHLSLAIQIKGIFRESEYHRPPPNTTHNILPSSPPPPAVFQWTGSSAGLCRCVLALHTLRYQALREDSTADRAFEEKMGRSERKGGREE